DRTHRIRLWDVTTGKLVRKLPAENNFIRAIAVSPDGKLLASATQDRTGTVRLWDVATGQLARTIQTRNTWTVALAFAPDGPALVTASIDTTALVWDLTGGQRTAHPLTDAQWRAAWQELGDPDAVKAYRSMWALAAAASQTVPALRERLRPIAP